MPQEYQLIVIFGMLAILMYYMIRNTVSYYPKFKYLFKQKLKRKYKMTPERDKQLETILADNFLNWVDKAYLDGEVTNDERYYLYEKYAKVWAIDDLKPAPPRTPPWDEIPPVEENPGLPKRKSLQELFNS